ncbi:L-serine ammonia-lyase, iron-sulfur-dependent, subunit alpha [Corynebacterium sp. TAE3-ERU12]|uniref:L-serine ammonia-lyase, iron-sulfur-dependent, subunit alpha n=1 Tax=Corynebacterium sp. TAE3-ERU12 TaxID=2849491 RepID=UPI001C46D147|nr:L-serine ammonia-lyase, iron-sulfur-dependent, subunit alpha [Corynebacterium sp. TAE3-ERU12]MBV7295365.1 L-serine ammonia-lyase, iron-sulfur-dependent, subunit alpha [Corynebacterium sp. TAE3-ERU12]
MRLSVVDIFAVGPGPRFVFSVGPMRAAQRFAAATEPQPGVLVDIELGGALTARAARPIVTRAIMLGLSGTDAQMVSPGAFETTGPRLGMTHTITGAAGNFSCRMHSNADDAARPDPGPATITMRYVDQANQAAGTTGSAPAITYRILPGGQVVANWQHHTAVPYEFSTTTELVAHAVQHNMTVAEVAAHNEATFHQDPDAAPAHLDQVWDIMRDSVAAGLSRGSVGPQRLTNRRAPARLDELLAQRKKNPTARGISPAADNWLVLYSLAVAEYAQAGCRVVAAPTGTAAAPVPAVLHHAMDRITFFTRETVHQFLFAAGAIGQVFAEADMHRDSGLPLAPEVDYGLGAAMAAAGLCEILGGSPTQVDNAAGLALDQLLHPDAGIDTTTTGIAEAAAASAVEAARLALRPAGPHHIRLDDVIADNSNRQHVCAG